MSNDLMETELEVRRNKEHEIKWFRMKYSSWRRNHQKYKSEVDKSRQGVVWFHVGSDVMFFIYGP